MLLLLFAGMFINEINTIAFFIGNIFGLIASGRPAIYNKKFNLR